MSINNRYVSINIENSIFSGNNVIQYDGGVFLILNANNVTLFNNTFTSLLSNGSGNLMYAASPFVSLINLTSNTVICDEPLT